MFSKPKIFISCQFSDICSQVWVIQLKQELEDFLVVYAKTS